MGKRCIGIIEAVGLAAAIQAADTAVKSGNIKLLGYEYSGYDGHIAVKIEGNVGAVKAAMAACRIPVEKMKEKSSLSDLTITVLKAALDDSVYNTLIRNKHTNGDPLQIASGKRAQGTSRQGKWVSTWDGKGKYIQE